MPGVPRSRQCEFGAGEAELTGDGDEDGTGDDEGAVVGSTVIGTARLAPLCGPPTVATVSVQLAGPAPAGDTVRVGTVSSVPPGRRVRPALVIVGQLPLPAIFPERDERLSEPLIVRVCDAFAVAWATLNSRLGGLATRGAGGLGLGPGDELGPGAGDELGPALGEDDGPGAPARRAANGSPEATGAPEGTMTLGVAWPGCTAADCGGIPPICWLPVCIAGSDEASIPEEHAARTDTTVRATKNVTENRDDTKDPRRRPCSARRC